MLINISNHPLKMWPNKQVTEATRSFGKVLDIPFPKIQPDAQPSKLQYLAKEYLEAIKNVERTHNEIAQVFVMGEMGFVFALVTLLKNEGYIVYHATSERAFTDGSRDRFNFYNFREY